MLNQQEQNQALIVAVYEAEKSDATAKAEVMSRAVELHKSRQQIFHEYDVFVDGFTALRGKAKKKPMTAEILAEITEQANLVPVPRYNPLDDFGVMEDVFNAALNNDFETMFRHAANALLPVDKARKDAGSVRRAIAVLGLFKEAKNPEQRKYALLRLRVYKGTLTKLHHTGVNE